MAKPFISRRAALLLLLAIVGLLGQPSGVVAEAHAACDVPGGGVASNGDYLSGSPGTTIYRCENDRWVFFQSGGEPPCDGSTWGQYWYTPSGTLICRPPNWEALDYYGCSDMNLHLNPAPTEAVSSLVLSGNERAPAIIFANCGLPHGHGRGLRHHPRLERLSRGAPGSFGYSTTVTV